MNKIIDDIKVVIGAGEYMNNPGWIHTQEEELNLSNENTWQCRFEKDSVKAILAEHVWEHLTYEEGLEAAAMVIKYLKPSGYIRCAVPDGNFPDEHYQNIVQVGGPGPSDHAAASHKIVHDFKSLAKMFETAGYEVRLLEYCDDEGNFHQNSWEGADGIVFRSKKYDPRNQGEKLVFPSLIIDAVKPK